MNMSRSKKKDNNQMSNKYTHKQMRKMLKGMSLFGMLLVVATAALMICLAPFSASGAVTLSGSVVGALGTSEEKAQAAEIFMNSVLKEVVVMSPSKASLTLLMDKFGKKAKAASWKQDGYEVTERPFEDVTTLTYTTSAGIKSGNLKVQNINNWTIDHTIQVQVGSDPTVWPMFLITAIDYANNLLTIQSIDPDGTGASTPDIPTIASGTKVCRLGQALSEKQADVIAFAEIPSKDFNYVQKFGAKVEFTFIEQMFNKEVDWGFADVRALRLKKMREEQELSAWVGVRGITVRTRNSQQEKIYTMGGILKSTGIQKLTYGTGGANRTLDLATLASLCESLFAGNAGSNVRYVFHGSKIGTYLTNGIANWTKMVQETSTEIVPGLTYSKYVCNFGELRFIYHPLFDKLGMAEMMAAIDLDNIVKASLYPLKATTLRLAEAGISQVDAVFFDEAFTVLTMYDGVHALIYPKA